MAVGWSFESGGGAPVIPEGGSCDTEGEGWGTPEGTIGGSGRRAAPGRGRAPATSGPVHRWGGCDDQGRRGRSEPVGSELVGAALGSRVRVEPDLVGT